jgi:hypothetical protein
MKQYIEDAGFINVTQREWKAPLGPWAAGAKWKEVGNWGLLELEVGLEGFAMAPLTRVYGVSGLIVCFFVFVLWRS